MVDNPYINSGISIEILCNRIENNVNKFILETKDKLLSGEFPYENLPLERTWMSTVLSYSQMKELEYEDPKVLTDIVGNMVRFDFPEGLLECKREYYNYIEYVGDKPRIVIYFEVFYTTEEYAKNLIDEGCWWFDFKWKEGREYVYIPEETDLNVVESYVEGSENKTSLFIETLIGILLMVFFPTTIPLTIIFLIVMFNSVRKSFS